MIDEFYFDEQAESLVELWGEIETELIKDISQRISKTLRLTGTAEYDLEQLKQANLLNEHAVELIAKNTSLSDSTIRDLIEGAGYNIVKQDETIYRRALESGQITLEPLPLNKSPMLSKAIQSCIEAAQYGLSNLTNTRMVDAGNGMETLTKAARREYYNAVNRGSIEVNTGAKTVQEAIKDSCKQLASKGITLTHWESGHTDTLETAVRRNIKTSMAQTAAKCTLARMDDYKHDLVEVSSHFGARPSHYVWQGKIYSLSNKSYSYYKEQCENMGYKMIDVSLFGGDFYSVTGYGTGEGLCGWNCRHRFYPYFFGITPVYPEYDEEENRKRYEETQEQRRLERQIRAAKRQRAALEGIEADESDIQAANAKIREKQKDLREYLKGKDLTRDYSREKIYK